MALRAIHTAILGSFQPGGSAATDWQAANCPGTKSFPIRPKDSFKFRMQYNFIRQEPGAKTMTSTSYRLWWYVGTFHGAVSTPALWVFRGPPTFICICNTGKFPHIMLIAQLHAIVLPGLRKYVAFILPLALRRRCRSLYLTVVFGHSGAPFGHKKHSSWLKLPYSL